jgi:hypothetical protein
MPELNAEFLSAVKDLVITVQGWLGASDGDDTPHILAMMEDVDDVIEKARGIPQLRQWAEAMAHEVELSKERAYAQ